jgi:hypothetical protein
MMKTKYIDWLVDHNWSLYVADEPYLDGKYLAKIESGMSSMCLEVEELSFAKALHALELACEEYITGIERDLNISLVPN